MRKLCSLFFIPIILVISSCTKVIVYANDSQTDVISKRYPGDTELVYARAVSVLQNLGYEFTTADLGRRHIVTGWKSAPAGAYYYSLFNRRDYSAATGTYYQLFIDIVGEGSYSRVDIRTNIKSLSGKLTSAGKIEEAIIKRLDDASRSPQIEMTNVGVSNK